MSVKTSINVNYKFRDGWHVFQSPEVPGFYVASKDAEKAFHDIAPSLQAAMRISLGIECEVEQEISFAQFKRAIAPKKKQPSLMASFLELRNQRFLVCAPA